MPRWTAPHTTTALRIGSPSGRFETFASRVVVVLAVAGLTGCGLITSGGKGGSVGTCGGPCSDGFTPLPADWILLGENFACEPGAVQPQHQVFENAAGQFGALNGGALVLSPSQGVTLARAAASAWNSVGADVTLTVPTSATTAQTAEIKVVDARYPGTEAKGVAKTACRVKAKNNCQRSYCEIVLYTRYKDGTFINWANSSPPTAPGSVSVPFAVGHEVGHLLGLDHIWAQSTQPSLMTTFYDPSVTYDTPRQGDIQTLKHIYGQ